MEQKHKIKIFSTHTCPYCDMVKRYLDEKGMEYEDVNVSSDPKAREEMGEKSGQMGVPVLEINDQVVVGFNKEKINNLLDIKE